VKLAPKIETQIGVNNLKEIAAAAETDLIMLDAEDLYTDCKTDPAVFSSYKAQARQSCKDIGIICLELKGVVFSHESKP
jgi:citrate lyase beta subunit